MAASDSSAQNVRFNQDSQQLEFALGTTWNSIPSSGIHAAGSNTQVQYNNSGALGASSSLTFTSSPVRLLVGDVIIGNNLNGTQGLLVLNDSSAGGNLTFQLPPAFSSSYLLIMPSAQGTANTVLQNDGFGNLSWALSPAIPTMTTTQRNAIASPAEGMTIYNLTTHLIDFYNGTTWKEVATV